MSCRSYATYVEIKLGRYEQINMNCKTTDSTASNADEDEVEDAQVDVRYVVYPRGDRQRYNAFDLYSADMSYIANGK